MNFFFVKLIISIFFVVSSGWIYYKIREFKNLYENYQGLEHSSRSEIPPLPNEDEAVLIFSKSLQYETTNNIVDLLPFLECVELMKKSFPLFFESVKTIEQDNFNNSAILFTLEGKKPELDPVILMSHIDVVPAEEEHWTVPPYSGSVKDGYIYGRGTLDNKISTFSSLQAMEVLLGSGYVPTRTFYFSITFDEESRNDGAESSVKYFEDRNIRPFIIFDEGGCLYRNNFESVPHDVALVSVNEKAGVLLNFTILCSETGHVSFSQSDSCIDIISEAVLKIKNFKFPSHSTYPVLTEFVETIFPHSTSKLEFIFFSLFRKTKFVLDFFFNKNKVMESLIKTSQMVSLLNVGKIYNVLPKEGYFVVDVRRFPGETIQYVKDEFIRLLKRPGIEDIKVEIIWGKLDHKSAPTGDTVQFNAIKDAILETYDNVIVTPFILPGGTNLQFYKGLSDFTYNFTPMVIDNELDDVSRIHGNDERIPVGDYLKAITFYESLILKLDRI